MTDDQQRRRRITLPWRVGFVVYAIALEIATIWPRLDLGEEGPSDKSVHLWAFGIVPILLWRTGWIRRLGVLYLLCLAWATLDELTQGLEILHRSMTWQDLAANFLGIHLAVMWIWAMRPVGGPGNRFRLDRYRYIQEEIFATWKVWIILLGVFGACAAPIALLWPVLKPAGIEGPIAFAVVIWGLVTGIIWSNIWRTHERAAIDLRECYACGASCAGIELDNLGAGVCPECGRPVHAGQWIETPHPPLRALVRLAAMPALYGVLILLGGFAIIALSAVLYDRLLEAGLLTPGLPRAVRIIGTERALMNAVDFAAVFIVFAIVARLFRHRLAHYYDQPFSCYRCGHDLRGTPTTGGVGRCGECGHAFARAIDLAGAA